MEPLYTSKSALYGKHCSKNGPHIIALGFRCKVKEKWIHSINWGLRLTHLPSYAPSLAPTMQFNETSMSCKSFSLKSPDQKTRISKRGVCIYWSHLFRWSHQLKPKRINAWHPEVYLCWTGGFLAQQEATHSLPDPLCCYLGLEWRNIFFWRFCTSICRLCRHQQ